MYDSFEALQRAAKDRVAKAMEGITFDDVDCLFCGDEKIVAEGGIESICPHCFNDNVQFDFGDTPERPVWVFGMDPQEYPN